MEVAMQLSSSALRHGIRIVLLLLVAVAMPRGGAASEGLLGIYSDLQATACDLAVPVGASRTFYVVFVPDGSTRGGIQGAEFQVDASEASGYLIASEESMGDISVGGGAFSGGTSIGWAQCQSDLAIPVLKFQVLNVGSGASDAPLQVRARSNPTNPTFACALANLCDAPTFTQVCVSKGVGFLNATGDVACGSGAQKRKWSGVKALYK
jgi:hypothetical protein